MTDLLIPPELAAKLAALAQHEQRTIPELLEAMLAQYHPAEITESAPDVPEAAPDTDADRDEVDDAQIEALNAMIGMFDDDVTDMSTTVRETMEKFWRQKK